MINHADISIYDAMKKIKDGKYAIPPFQREFVWTKEKIVKLWDSILMGYPISTFLFWKYNYELGGAAKFLLFTSNAKFRAADKTIASASGSAIPSKIEHGILDGQQRLTSLFLSLFGYFSQLTKNQRKDDNGNPIDIYIDLTESVNAENDDEGFDDVKNYEIKFSEKNLRSPFFKLRDIISDSFRNIDTRTSEIEKRISDLADDAKLHASQLLHLLCARIYDEELIHYQEAIDEESEALEMFIRFNNGGKPLTKSDIADATISYYWKEAPEKFRTVVKYKGNLDLVEPELQGYKNFGLNFIIRLGTMLFEDNVASNLGGRIIKGLKDNWFKVKDSLKQTSNMLKSKGIDVSNYQSRWNVLLPIIYFIYSNPEATKKENDILAYLVRATLLKYFQNGTTAKLTKIKKMMGEHQYQGKPVLEISLLDEIPELKITEAKINDILESKKGSPLARIALEWVNFSSPMGQSLGMHEDHMQPYSSFNGLYPPTGVSAEEWNQWKNYRDMLPNLQFFEGQLNKFKSNTELYQFYDSIADGPNGKEAYEKSYLLFPIQTDSDKELLLLQNFGYFFEKRRSIMKERLSILLGAK